MSTNLSVISVNQDSLGRQGRKIRDNGDFEVWSKELQNGSRTVLLFNRSETNQEIGFEWFEVGMLQNMKLNARDLWLKKEMGKFEGSYPAEVPSHGAVMLRVY